MDVGVGEGMAEDSSKGLAEDSMQRRNKSSTAGFENVDTDSTWACCQYRVKTGQNFTSLLR